MPCSVCHHPAREKIDAGLDAGRPVKRLAAEFEVSHQSVRRHRDGGHASRPVVAPPTQPTGPLCRLCGVQLPGGTLEVIARALQEHLQGHRLEDARDRAKLRDEEWLREGRAVAAGQSGQRRLNVRTMGF